MEISSKNRQIEVRSALNVNKLSFKFSHQNCIYCVVLVECNFFLKLKSSCCQRPKRSKSVPWRKRKLCQWDSITCFCLQAKKLHQVLRRAAAAIFHKFRLILRISFLQMYDKDGSGTIELNEMIEVMTALQCMDGASKEAAAVRGRRIFEELDINDDGEISCEEFVRGCMMDPELVRTITAGGLDPLEEECY